VILTYTMNGGNTTATIRGVIVGVLISCLYSVFCSSNLTVGIGRTLLENDYEVEIYEKLEASSIVCIVILLILITIAFEVSKEKIEDSVSKTNKPIIESLFGEMTILGFLSVLIFFLMKSGLFEMLSTELFGNEEHEPLVEIVEQVHFALFFIMIIFVIQVLVLAKQGMNTEREWLKMERKCHNSAYIAKITTNPEGRDDEKQLLYHALREEFINERSMDPPFLPTSIEHRVPADFNFGRYLSISLGNTAAHIVHLHESSWAFFIFFTIVVYVIFIALDLNMEVSLTSCHEGSRRYTFHVEILIFVSFLPNRCLHGLGQVSAGCHSSATLSSSAILRNLEIHLQQHCLKPLINAREWKTSRFWMARTNYRVGVILIWMPILPGDHGSQRSYHPINRIGRMHVFGWSAMARSFTFTSSKST